MEGGLSRPQVYTLTIITLRAGIFVSHIYLSGRKKLFLPPENTITEELREAMDREGFEMG